MKPLPAVIVAGGGASRMGGGDKCLLPLAGHPMLATIVERLAGQTAPLALNANGDPDRFAAFGLPVLADTVSKPAGPLAGLLAAMDWAASATGAQAVVTVAGDTPYLPVDLVQRLSEASAGSARVALAASQNRLHPVFGLWPLAYREALVRYLVNSPTFRVASFAQACGFVQVDFDFDGLDPFFNVNTPEDLETAEAHFGKVDAR